MDITLGKRIAMYRKAQGFKQEDLAAILGVSGQAVSKWENDQTCPDISLLPPLAETLGVSVDELLSGKKETAPVVQILPEEKRKNTNDMVLRIVVKSADGDKLRINLPMALIQAAMDSGFDVAQISGNGALKHVDWKQIMPVLSQGITGNLVEVESAEGDIVQIFVE